MRNLKWQLQGHIQYYSRSTWYICISIYRVSRSANMIRFTRLCVPLVCRNYLRGRLPATATTFRHTGTGIFTKANHE